MSTTKEGGHLPTSSSPLWDRIQDQQFSRIETSVLEELRAIFPNHGDAVIRRAVKNAGEGQEEMDMGELLPRCIDELISVSPSHDWTEQSAVTQAGGQLSPLQQEVVQELTSMFPRLADKQIKASVQHRSNTFRPLSKPTLLQRCIDDLLDGRTAPDVCFDDDDDYDIRVKNDDEPAVSTETDMLVAEANLPIEELMAKYSSAGPPQTTHKKRLQNNDNNTASPMIVAMKKDDEPAGGTETDMLVAEANLPIEELMAKYSSAGPPQTTHKKRLQNNDNNTASPMIVAMKKEGNGPTSPEASIPSATVAKSLDQDPAMPTGISMSTTNSSAMDVKLSVTSLTSMQNTSAKIAETTLATMADVSKTSDYIDKKSGCSKRALDKAVSETEKTTALYNPDYSDTVNNTDKTVSISTPLLSSSREVMTDPRVIQSTSGKVRQERFSCIDFSDSDTEDLAAADAIEEMLESDDDLPKICLKSRDRSPRASAYSPYRNAASNPRKQYLSPSKFSFHTSTATANPATLFNAKKAQSTVTSSDIAEVPSLQRNLSTTSAIGCMSLKDDSAIQGSSGTKGQQLTSVATSTADLLGASPDGESVFATASLPAIGKSTVTSSAEFNQWRSPSKVKPIILCRIPAGSDMDLGVTDNGIVTDPLYSVGKDKVGCTKEHFQWKLRNGPSVIEKAPSGSFTTSDTVLAAALLPKLGKATVTSATSKQDVVAPVVETFTPAYIDKPPYVLHKDQVVVTKASGVSSSIRDMPYPAGTKPWPSQLKAPRADANRGINGGSLFNPQASVATSSSTTSGRRNFTPGTRPFPTASSSAATGSSNKQSFASAFESILNEKFKDFKNNFERSGFKEFGMFGKPSSSEQSDDTASNETFLPWWNSSSRKNPIVIKEVPGGCMAGAEVSNAGITLQNTIPLTAHSNEDRTVTIESLHRITYSGNNAAKEDQPGEMPRPSTSATVQKPQAAERTRFETAGTRAYPVDVIELDESSNDSGLSQDVIIDGMVPIKGMVGMEDDEYMMDLDDEDDPAVVMLDDPDPDHGQVILDEDILPPPPPFLNYPQPPPLLPDWRHYPNPANMHGRPKKRKIPKGKHRRPKTPEVVAWDTVQETLRTEVADLKNDVLALFPDVDLAHVDKLCEQYNGPMALNTICNTLLENNYPRKQLPATPTGATASATIVRPKESDVDYFSDYMSANIPSKIINTYVDQTYTVLGNDYSWISGREIRRVMDLFQKHYAPSYQELGLIWRQAKDAAAKNKTRAKATERGMFSQLMFDAEVDSGSSKATWHVKLLKNRRLVLTTKKPIIPELQQEIEFVKKKLVELAKEADMEMAKQLNEKEYEEEGQCIECGCCFGEYPFESMIQCCEGHLFCQSCLKQYAKEAVYGHGKAVLKCMTQECDTSFPKSQLEKALPSEMMAKYEDRVQEENINLAELENLVKCPHCDYAAILDPWDKVFACMKCEKATCRHCKEIWEDHFGKRCEEVEKKDETSLRLAYEEKMTQAKVRICQKCKAQFMKEDGCNKMTCRCGATMCYICRIPDISYKHFCQHPRDPGKECKKCKACSLWTNPEEDDNRAVREIQREADEKRKEKGFTEDRLIGAPDEPPVKKARH